MFAYASPQPASFVFVCRCGRTCRRVTKARQTAFGCATNVWQTAERYPLTVGTSKGIHIQYIYVGNAEQYMFCIVSLSHASFAFAFRCKPGLTRTHISLWSDGSCPPFWNLCSCSFWRSKLNFKILKITIFLNFSRFKVHYFWNHPRITYR